jgi:flagellar protein FliO/FliZ
MDALATLGRLGLALAFVLGALWLIARFAQRRGRTVRRSQALAVLARQSLGKNSSVAVIKVMDRAMVVGVTDQQVSLLGETDLAEVERKLEEAKAAGRTGPVKNRAALTVVDAETTPARPASIGRRLLPAAPQRPAVAKSGVKASAKAWSATRPAAEASSALAGSALSPATWKQAVEAVRERTVRRA